jgi:iron complex transport system substrate-binding protein
MLPAEVTFSRRTFLQFATLPLFGSCRAALPEARGTRIVSLAPALTETLFALGAAELVVAASDYCEYPPEVKKLPRAGTSLTPNLEVLVSLRPTMILGQESRAARLEELQAIAPVTSFPWLTVGDLVQSTQRLGELIGRVAESRALAERYRTELADRSKPSSPRVLLIFGDNSRQVGSIATVWFQRRNSIHGAALAAAGARNAVDRDMQGQPGLSLEEVLALDPDQLIILSDSDAGGEAYKREVIQPWKQLTTLRAVQRERVDCIAWKGVLSPGPRLLNLVRELAPLIERGA